MEASNLKTSRALFFVHYYYKRGLCAADGLWIAL